MVALFCHTTVLKIVLMSQMEEGEGLMNTPARRLHRGAPSLLSSLSHHSTYTKRPHLRASSAHKAHDASPSIGVGGLQEADGQRNCHTSGPQRTHSIGDWPGVSLEVANQVSEVHITLLERLEEPAHTHTTD